MRSHALRCYVTINEINGGILCDPITYAVLSKHKRNNGVILCDPITYANLS